jgi:hypothetical protein
MMVMFNAAHEGHLTLSWQGDSEKNKYRLTKWNVVCRPKDQGGFSIHDLEVKSRAILGKWLFKLLTKNGIWQTILNKVCWLKGFNVPGLLEIA